jgi:hypothetical protein
MKELGIFQFEKVVVDEDEEDGTVDNLLGTIRIPKNLR